MHESITPSNFRTQNRISIVPHIADKRFFTVPTFSTPIDVPPLMGKLIHAEQGHLQDKGRHTMLYAAYMRVSSEEQVGNFSIDAQRRAIEAWVTQQGGTITKYYIDEGVSGRTSERPAFVDMRRDAKNRRFDALVVHKFDRFSRNRTDALAIKSLLRHDYGIKVFSVTEPSEDSDGAIGALIEGIMESVADWYSRNLAQETVKGKKERAMQGYHNNRAPFGFDKDADGVLVPNDKEVEAVKLAFNNYATGKATDNQIAIMLNDLGYMQKSGNRFNTEMIRSMLQNRIYLGFVRYEPYERKANGSRKRTGQRKRTADDHWIKGKHSAIIDETLFIKCQEIRYAKATTHQYYPKFRVYLLRDLLYCAECTEKTPDSNRNDRFGKMRPQTDRYYMRYRCMAHDYGRKCNQSSVHAADIEQQVINILMNLKPPVDWRTRIVAAMGELIGDQKLDERINEIKAIIERMDFRWDHGFVGDQNAYLEERIKLQQELEKLTPIADDELEVAADILTNFAQHWADIGDDRKKQYDLIQLIVGRVWVRDEHVVGLSLRANYHVALGVNKMSTNVVVDGAEDNLLPDRDRRGSNPRSLT